MTTGLRKGLTDYGDPKFSLFLRKAFIKAMGYSDDALDRPIVGITNTYSDYNPCHGNVPELIESVKRGVMLAGGLPMVFPTISIAESFAHPTSMFLRNLLAMETEEMIRAQPMDAVVVIGGCDKNLPAQVMAAISVDLPTVVLPTGPMLVGHHQGQVIGACTDCRRFWAQHRAGQLGTSEMDVISGRLCPSVGFCGVMGTASTMACIIEALGLSLPFAATAPAPHAERRRIAEASGKRAAQMARDGGPRPQEIVTASSIRNAMVVLQAIGGSTNGLIHLTAMAGRLGICLDLEAFDDIGRKTPVLVDLKPAGNHYMEDFHYAGGMPALLSRLGSSLDTSLLTVSGEPLKAMIDRAEMVPNQQIVRCVDSPVSDQGGMAILRGNLAPRRAVIKHSAASPHLLRHTGRAVVFDSVQDMSSRIDSPDLDVTPEDVLVLRNAGPKGAPGMPEAGYLPIPLKLARRGVKDMVRLSDARMSGTAFGTIVLHITPESAVGGPLAIVRSGDRIALDVEARTLNLLVDDQEIGSRLATWNSTPPHRARPTRGYAQLFEDHILQADDGCDFDFLQGSPVSLGTSSG